MSVELIEYMPVKGDYVFVHTAAGGVYAAGRVSALSGGTARVRIAGRTTTVRVPLARLSEHPQNDWGQAAPITSPAPVPQSGYTACACRDCMDDTVSSNTVKPELCTECTDAGCVAIAPYNERVQFCGTYECQRDDAYSNDWESDDTDAGTGHGAYEWHSGA